MGSPCEFHLYAHTMALARAAALRAQAEVRRLEAAYSGYRDDSLATRINRSAGKADGVEVDEETAALLDYAQVAWEQSAGLFDITAGALRRVWDYQRRQVPSSAAIAEVLPHVGWDKLRWRRPHLVLRQGMALDFGGFVKEYAADSACRVCRESGIAHGLVELGGDIAVVGAHPDGAAWQVGIRHPRNPERAIAAIPLASGAIASSGDYERYFEVDGQRYCHILNPKTGWPAQGLMAASVVGDQCLIAGTASTVAMLKGAGAPTWLEELGLRHLCVAADGGITAA